MSPKLPVIVVGKTPGNGLPSCSYPAATLMLGSRIWLLVCSGPAVCAVPCCPHGPFLVLPSSIWSINSGYKPCFCCKIPTCLLPTLQPAMSPLSLSITYPSLLQGHIAAFGLITYWVSCLTAFSLEEISFFWKKDCWAIWIQYALLTYVDSSSCFPTDWTTQL